MLPIEIEQTNVVFAANQPEYNPLPAFRSADGCVTTCWKLTFVERLKLLLGGKLFLSMLTFNNPLQPIKLGTSFEEVQ